ncbi:hypothetical protein SteCoe_16256 [Stentor coeruleus]|uniref:Uncharacterized protein n=1 Tax=Stentor coeruleus TaxID=5963 RepID=A0A1R2C1W2_9CILI|nr:hypothetical protein SteCoe_16256 [Stentor coeruleus]
MGAHNSSNPSQKYKLPLTKIYYLNRIEKSILIIEEKSTEKVRLENIDLYKDSAIGYITSSSIIVIGGCDSKGLLKSTGYIIDFNTKKADIIAPIPIPCKFGNISFYKSWVFHVGGVIFDNLVSDREVPSPIMKYNLHEKFWVQFNQESNYEMLNEHENFKSLMEPGSFILNKKLYIFGGYSLVSGFRKKKNSIVYSINLEDLPLGLDVECYDFPYSVYRPMTGVVGQSVIIGGGRSLDGMIKKGFIEFIEKTKDDNKFKNFDIEGFELEENYPPWCTEEMSYFIAYPKLAMKIRDQWTVISLGQKKPPRASSTKLAIAPPKMVKSPTIEDLAFTSKSSQLYSISQLTMRSISSVDFRALSANGTIVSNGDSIDLRCRSLKNMQGLFKNQHNLHELDLSLIITTENDEDVTVIHKSALKLLAQASDKLLLKTLNALDINNISAQLEFKELVNIKDLFEVLYGILTAKAYLYTRIVSFVKIIHKILDHPRLLVDVFGQIFKMLGISKRDQMIAKDKTIMLLTRIIKATVVDA